jgi:hypothetical protein
MYNGENGGAEMVSERTVAPEQPDFPDVFADSVAVTAAPFGFTFTFLLTDPDAGPDGNPRPVGRVRISPELASAFVGLLTSAVETHRSEVAKREAAAKPTRGKAVRSRSA